MIKKGFNKKNKRGNILTENVIFIVLNLVFLSIIFLFLFSRAGGTGIYEEKYAKQIALIIDSAKPGMKITLDMKKAFDEKEEDFSVENMVVVDNEKNIVMVRLKEGLGYSYSFFNDVQVSAYPGKDKTYIIFIT